MLVIQNKKKKTETKTKEMAHLASCECFHTAQNWFKVIRVI